MSTTIEEKTKKRLVQLSEDLKKTNGYCSIRWTNKYTGEVTPYQNRHILSISTYPDRVEVEEEHGQRPMKSGKKGYEFQTPVEMLEALIIPSMKGTEIFSLKKD